MTVTTTIGFAAATCTTISYAPQVLKLWRTRSASDISASMFLLMVTGIILWLVYGTIIGDLPLILANAVALCLTGTILAFKLCFG